MCDLIIDGVCFVLYNDSRSATRTSSYRWRSTARCTRCTCWSDRTWTSSCARWASYTSACCSRPVWPSTPTRWRTCSTSGASSDRVSSANRASSTAATTSRTSAGSAVTSTASSLSTTRPLLTSFIPTTPYVARYIPSLLHFRAGFYEH